MWVVSLRVQVSHSCRHPSRPEAESPGEVLRAGLGRWLAGGSYWGPPPLDLGDRLEQALRFARALEDPRAAGARAKQGEQASVEVRAAATDVLSTGLRQRVPAWPEWGVILHLDDGEWRTYRALLDLGAELPRGLGGHAPAGVGVCDDCRGIFRPSRKGWAFKCPECHASKGQRARPITGWEVRSYRRCEVCQREFAPSRAHARHCSGRCRTAASRERSRG